jgi:hypothetical protein
MSYFYLVPEIGTGTEHDPYRPDLPDQTTFHNHLAVDGQCLAETRSPVRMLLSLSTERIAPEMTLRSARLDAAVEIDALTDGRVGAEKGLRI